MERIFLIGFMGCGKTTTGKIIARELGWRFIDMDELIESKAGKTINQIFKDEGEDAFRKFENKILLETFQYNKVIIATGGGAPCFYDNMKIMNKKGLTLYLKAPSEVLLSRLEEKRKNRPLLKSLNKDELDKFIKNKLKVREPYYQKSQLIHNNVDSQLQDLIEKIRESIGIE